MDTYTLCWREFELGQISDVSTDSPWLIGAFAPSSAANQFRDFFAALVSEDEPLPNLEEFPPEWLDDANWYLKNANGQSRGVCVPAVHWPDEIWWQWS